MFLICNSSFMNYSRMTSKFVFTDAGCCTDDMFVLLNFFFSYPTLCGWKHEAVNTSDEQTCDTRECCVDVTYNVSIQRVRMKALRSWLSSIRTKWHLSMYFRCPTVGATENKRYLNKVFGVALVETEE